MSCTYKRNSASNKSHLSIFFCVGIVLILLNNSFYSVHSSAIQETSTSQLTPVHNTYFTNFSDAEITCFSQGKTSITIVPYESASYFKELFSSLTIANAQNPNSNETKQLKQDILLFAEEHKLLPNEISTEVLIHQFINHPQINNPLILTREKHLISNSGIGREFFCNFVSTGEGSLLPIIVLPRLIPIIMTPIPRLFVGWKTDSGITSCGGLLSQTGFYAVGPQQGLALGFWGIGFSIFLPPVRAYAMFGYAIYAQTSAEHIEYYPPNNPPQITQTSPVDNQEYVSLSLSKLEFQLYDADNDLMSFKVTTNPYIGSGEEGLKPNGIYSIPISGLKSFTTYTWTVQVTDGKSTTEKTFTFTTEPLEPQIIQPIPANGEKDVPMDIEQLQFTLTDYQGDTMDYTVETSPFIGSSQAYGVHNGTYTVAVTGLSLGMTYRWYVNVTDGTYDTHKTFIFETGYPSQYNPFEFGWQYRKQISINHTLVADDYEHFPVLISTTDVDLTKCNSDGNDLLFMDGAGVATRIFHEIETFDQTSGKLVAFVNLPMLYSQQDNKIYLYYGNPNCINQQYPEKVWNTNFKAVWHLHQSPIQTITDSTIFGNNASSHGSMASSNVVQAKVGKGLYFNGIDDYLSSQDSPSLKPSEVTILCWINVISAVTGGRSVLGKGCTDKWGNKDAVSYGISYIDNEMGTNAEKDDNTQTIAKYPASQNNWYHTAMTYNSTTKVIKYYQDGILRDSVFHGQSLRYNGPWEFIFAAGHTGVGSGINYFYECILDEIWIVNKPLTAGWIATVYTNQNDPMNFLSFGIEEQAQ